MCVSKYWSQQVTNSNGKGVSDVKRDAEVEYLGSTLMITVGSFQEEVHMRMMQWTKAQAVSANILPRLPWESFMKIVEKPCKVEEAIVADAAMALGGGQRGQFLIFLFSNLESVPLWPPFHLRLVRRCAHPLTCRSSM